MKTSEKVAFTASRFASLTGIDRSTLARRLTEQNAKPVSTTGRGDEFSLRDLHNAATGGNQATERLRKLRAECEKLELDVAVRRREFVSAAEVEKLGQAVVIEIREIILHSILPRNDQDAILWKLVALKDMDFLKKEPSTDSEVTP